MTRESLVKVATRRAFLLLSLEVLERGEGGTLEPGELPLWSALDVALKFAGERDDWSPLLTAHLQLGRLHQAREGRRAGHPLGLFHSLGLRPPVCFNHISLAKRCQFDRHSTLWLACMPTQSVVLLSARFGFVQVLCSTIVILIL